MAIHGNLTYEAYEAIINNEDIRSQLEIPESASYDLTASWLASDRTFDLEISGTLGDEFVNTAFSWIEGGGLHLSIKNISDFSFCENITSLLSLEIAQVQLGGEQEVDFSSFSNLTRVDGLLRFSYIFRIGDFSGFSNLVSAGSIEINFCMISSMSGIDDIIVDKIDVSFSILPETVTFNFIELNGLVVSENYGMVTLEFPNLVSLAYSGLEGTSTNSNSNPYNVYIYRNLGLVNIDLKSLQTLGSGVRCPRYTSIFLEGVYNGNLTSAMSIEAYNTINVDLSSLVWVSNSTGRSGGIYVQVEDYYYPHFLNYFNDFLSDYGIEVPSPVLGIPILLDDINVTFGKLEYVDDRVRYSTYSRELDSQGYPFSFSDRVGDDFSNTIIYYGGELRGVNFPRLRYCGKLGVSPHLIDGQTIEDIDPIDSDGFSNLLACNETLNIIQPFYNLNGFLNYRGDVSLGAYAIHPSSFEQYGYNALTCTLNNHSGLRNGIMSAYPFYSEFWHQAYPDGVEDCVLTPADIVPTPVFDITPDLFNFTALSGQNPNVEVVSDIITVSGFDVTLSVNITGGINTKVSKSGGEFIDRGTYLSVTSGDTIQLKTTTPPELEESIGVIIDVGNVRSLWSVSTTENDTPIVTGSIDDLTIEYDEEINISLEGLFEDPNGHELTYSLQSEIPSLTIVDNHIVGRLSVNDIGIHSVTVIATDELGERALIMFNVRVEVRRDANRLLEAFKSTRERVAAEEITVEEANAELEELYNNLTVN